MKFKAHISESGVVSGLTTYLQDLITTDNVTVFCIGSDRLTGDCLGPLIGTMLSESEVGWHIIGTLESPVHAQNIKYAITDVPSNHTVIAIDACLGKAYEVGSIECWEGTIDPGIAVGNKLPSVGDIALYGVVNAGGCLSVQTLQTTSLYRVRELAKTITEALINVHDATCYAKVI